MLSDRVSSHFQKLANVEENHGNAESPYRCYLSDAKSVDCGYDGEAENEQT